ncbi:MAG: hypothetical protein IRZ33_06140 [Alicyclobacillaceae bacterium]|nr:hypothetical protein [Alicyclobacillaceae bacterium]
MSGGWHDWLLSLACLLFTGAAVKLMDDYLDAEYDICRGQRTMASKLGRATLPYSLVLALLGAYLSLHEAVALFLASYAVGMLSAWRERLPTRMPAYLEMAAAVGLSYLLVGWRLTLWGVAMMALVDWLDDVIDMAGDTVSGQRNLAVRVGVVETSLLCLAALLVAVLTNASLTVLAFLAVTVLTILSDLTTTRLWRTFDPEGGIKL